jgi:transcriptional regulator with XRE-family HTH domain
MIRQQTSTPIGQAVRRRRAELRLSQEAASNRAGLSSTYWSNLESGKHGNLQDVTKMGIAAALAWPDNWVDVIQSNDSPSAILPEVEHGEAHEVLTRLAGLLEGVAGLQGAIAGLQGEVAELRSEVAELRSEVE